MKAAAGPQQSEGPTLGFVGAGMMATAMINGIIASKVCMKSHQVPGSGLLLLLVASDTSVCITDRL